MLIKGKLSKDYYDWLYKSNFIKDIKTADVVVKKFIDDDLKKVKSLIDVNRFDPKSKNLLLNLLNGTDLDSLVSRNIDNVPFKDLKSIDTIIEKVLDDLKPEFKKISTDVVKIVVREFPFPDYFVEEIKDEIKAVIQLKVSHSLYKKKKLFALNHKDHDYQKQLKEYTDFIEKLVDDRIKSLTLTIKSGVINVQGSSSAQSNVVPIIINDSVS